MDVRGALRSNRIFGSLGEDAFEAAAAVAELRSVEVGDWLFREGTPQATTFVVAEGRVEVLHDRRDGGRRLTVLGPGDGVAQGAMLETSTHSVSARAISPATVVELDGERVRGALADDAPAAMELFAAVSRVLQQRALYASAGHTGMRAIYRSGGTRTEHDLLGERQVPRDALYGIQTLRAIENFAISGIRLSQFPTLIRALAMVKQAACRANLELGLIEPDVAAAIDRACQEIVDGHWHGHFAVDMVQGGAGTSTNMNANEVIANRALELMGHPRGDYRHCHPNNHVNRSQSTNDVYPSAVRIAALLSVRSLLAALTGLMEALRAKGGELADVIKMGRTQLQDAVPMTLGQELVAFAHTTGEDVQRIEDAARLLLEVNLGGTAIGTGITVDPRYPELVVTRLREVTRLDLALAENLVEATPDTGAFVMFSGTLKRTAVKLSKMCNDLRLLSSGPRCGLNEINLPPRQPGSSIMPGKVNPVIPEMVNQVAFQTIGNDLTLTLAAEGGQLQLNVFEPIITLNLFLSLDMMTAAIHTLTTRCIVGITANRERCRDMVERSIGIVTAVMPALGYARSSEVAKEALETGTPIREIILRDGDLTPQQLDELLSPEAMTAPRPQ